MALGHEKLDVYRLAIGYVAWVFERAEQLSGLHRHARDQWLRASQSIPLNIAEGNAKATEADRRKYFEIARGSALECAAIQDVLVVGRALDNGLSQQRKSDLDRIAAMLTKLGRRGYTVGEPERSLDAVRSPAGDCDSESDCDREGLGSGE
ncbi:four helix bundle protein [Cerasicoccus maritimus]|uniref:four helix bundle protein n=1 Tax=Cerasicoccus maritimus TaxID=490089 RepID=UPI002852D289|nr:four helix bundle protein [Cerasicoccus maritimus]